VVIRVRQGPAAPDRDEPRVADLAQDHGRSMGSLRRLRSPSPAG
jgi:hypothetical protein